MPNKRSSQQALYLRIFLRTVIVILFVLALLYLFIPAIKVFSPLIAAALVSYIFLKPVRKIRSKYKIPRWLDSTICVLLTLALLVVPLYFLGRTAYTQGSDLARMLRTETLEVSSELQDGYHPLNKVWSTLPEVVQDFITNSLTKLQNFLQSSGSQIVNKGLQYSRLIISHAAIIGLWLITFFMSLFFIIYDYDALYNFFKKRISKLTWSHLTLLKDTSLMAVGRYIRGLVHLAVFCVVFMLIAFGIYRYPYTVVLSLGLGILDILPIVGALTALVPWFIIELIIGNTKFGIFLLSVSLVYFIARKLVEPKIMGDATGLHPLITLTSAYIAFRYFGVTMAILLPIIILVVIKVFESGVFDDWWLDLYELRTRVRITLKRGKKSN